MIVIINNCEVILTNDTIKKTKNTLIDSANKCIKEAVEKVVIVNDLDRYIKFYLDYIEKIKISERHSLTFIQKAVEIQTGLCCSIL
jgi:hypothetical protein